MNHDKEFKPLALEGVSTPFKLRFGQIRLGGGMVNINMNDFQIPTATSTGEVLVKDIEWSYVLSVGNDEIDEDHHRLIDLFNILNHSVTEGGDPEYLAAVLEELINCTVWHFSHEERLMLKYGYEGLAEHKAEHQELIQSVKELQQKFLQMDNRVPDEDLEFLGRWLTGHILSTDMKLGSYLTEVV